MEREPCPPNMQERCPVFYQEGECYEDKHHKYWPAPEYRTKNEKKFRELEVNKIIICRWLHNTIHAVALPPEMPTPVQMKRAIHEEESKG